MSMEWFRSWHGAPTDSKWIVIGKRAGVAPGIVSAIIWALLDFASQNSQRGSISGFDVETYCAFSGFDETQCNAVIVSLKDKGVLIDGMFINWQKRQPKRDDNSTARVRKYRDKSKAKDNETQCNADETQCNTMERQTREEKIRTPLTPQRGEVGVLKNGKGKEKNGSAYDIKKFLSSYGCSDAKRAAPDWDILHLAEVYNTGIHSGERDPPTQPDSAFPAWCAAYTKGNPP